ncbi:MAG: A/G-specific adenine glycosylase [Bacteroidetes bacterium]|nr:A/G-specific adenine glycosylase [Bacteroidota bacterium]
MERWFSGGLKKWYGVNKRDLPWRNETDAYRIWLSEIILQQTQVAQGLAYYRKFITNYPTIRHLAKASEDKVLKDWQGLGYYSRARNLHATARHIASNYKGVFPEIYKDIKALKGVGDYTAAAIASFAFNQPHAVVDGNVYRVLSRVFGIETPMDSGKGKKQFQELASELLDRKDPATHNQAIMEFGSQWCRPLNPDCEHCIFNSKCFAFKNELTASLPVKEKKTKIRARYFNYLVIIDKKQNVMINRRSEGDIWQGLYEFALLETEKEITGRALLKHPGFHKHTGKKAEIIYTSNGYKHVLSHQHLFAKFYVIKTNTVFKKSIHALSLKNLEKPAFPRLIEKFLNDCDLMEIC